MLKAGGVGLIQLFIGSSAASSRHCCVTTGHVGDWDLKSSVSHSRQPLAHFRSNAKTLKPSLSLADIFRNNKQVGNYVLSLYTVLVNFTHFGTDRDWIHCNTDRKVTRKENFPRSLKWFLFDLSIGIFVVVLLLNSKMYRHLGSIKIAFIFPYSLLSWS